MSGLKRRIGDLRPEVMDISALLQEHNKTMSDVVDIVFQLFKGDAKLLDKKLTDTNTTIIKETESHIKINWVPTDFDNLDKGIFRWALGVKMGADEEEQNPDVYELENGTSLGEDPIYEIVSKATV